MAGIIRQIDTNDDTLFHKWCHCKEVPLPPLDIDDIDIIIEYLFRAKSDWVAALGYDPSDRNKFVDELKKKTKKGYVNGDYIIQDYTKYGVKIRVVASIDGAHKDRKKEYKVIGSYMVFPNGKIKMNTPMGGKIEE